MGRSTEHSCQSSYLTTIIDSVKLRFGSYANKKNKGGFRMGFYWIPNPITQIPGFSDFPVYSLSKIWFGLIIWTFLSFPWFFFGFFGNPGILDPDAFFFLAWEVPQKATSEKRYNNFTKESINYIVVLNNLYLSETCTCMFSLNLADADRDQGSFEHGQSISRQTI